MYIFVIVFLSLFISRPLSEVLEIEPLRFLPLFTFLAGTIRYTFSKRGVLSFGVPFEKRGYLLFLTVIALYGLSIFRVSGGGFTYMAVVNYIAQFILIFTFLYTFINYYFSTLDSIKELNIFMMRAILWVLNIFLLLNFVVYLGGMGAKEVGAFLVDENSTMAGIFGIDLVRDGYFLTGHPNSFGGFLGMISGLNFLGFFYMDLKKRERIGLLFMMAICVFSFLLIDSRGALGATILGIAGIIGLQKIRALWIVPRATIFIPLLSLVVISLLQVFAETDIAKQISRDPEELASGNNRSVIWKYCMEELQDFKVDHLTGYGQLGHIKSGVANKWSRAMKGWKTYTHNFLFQTVLDLGYLGLIAILAVIFIGARYSLAIYNKGHPYMMVFLGAPILYMLSGITEAPFGVSNFLYTNLFFVLFLMPILMYDMYQKAAPSEKEEIVPEEELTEVVKQKTRSGF